jgi:hypothetical protein
VSEFAPGPEPVRPPGTVKTSSYLLYAVAAIEVVSLIVTLATLSTYRQALQEAYAGTDMESSGDTAAVLVAVFIGAIALVIGIGLVVLGFLNMRGRNTARIVTWVLGGLFVLCCGISSVANVVFSGVNFGSSGNTDALETQRRLEAALDANMPSWYEPVNTTLSVIPIVLVLVALILLTLPASNAFFAKKPAAWEPPTPGYPMPGSSYPAPHQPGEPPLPPPPSSWTPPGPPTQGGEPPETPAPPR